MFNIEGFTNTATQGGEFDFSQLGGLFSNTSSSSPGGFNLNQLGGLTSGWSGGSQASNNTGSTIGGVLGGIAGTLIPIPGLGTALGAGIGSAIGGIFGGGGVPDHERSDLQKIAANNNITEQQASNICGYEESNSPRNYDEIVKQAASDSSFLQQIWAKYNRDHPGSPILPQQASQASNTQAQVIAQLQAIAQAKAEEQAKAQEAAQKAKDSKTTTYAILGGGALLAVIIAILLLKK